jgi:uncharacterized protein (TIGR01777 family)
MKITIAGGTGFLGRNLVSFLESKHHEVIVLSRNPKGPNQFYWDGKTKGDWCKAAGGSDVLINLSGKSVDCRYTPENKREILDSRLKSTYTLHDFILETPKKPKVWLNASSATAYIHAENILMDENQGIIGDDFSMNVCKEWEKAFFAKTYPEIRQVTLRTAIVFGNDGGAYPRFRLLSKLGLGGKHGSGNQKVSWVHIDDFCRAVEFIIQVDEIEGAVNICAPSRVSNFKLSKLIQKKYKVPFALNHPIVLLELGAAIIGTETELLLKSRNVFPGILSSAGFNFKYNRIEECLVSLD